jgi:hypothetical protein
VVIWVGRGRQAFGEGSTRRRDEAQREQEDYVRLWFKLLPECFSRNARTCKIDGTDYNRGMPLE